MVLPLPPVFLPVLSPFYTKTAAKDCLLPLNEFKSESSECGCKSQLSPLLSPGAECLPFVLQIILPLFHPALGPWRWTQLTSVGTGWAGFKRGRTGTWEAPFQLVRKVGWSLYYPRLACLACSTFHAVPLGLWSSFLLMPIQA